MEPSEARDHLELVERILSTSSRTLETGGEIFLVWGLLAGGFDILLQLVDDGRLPTSAVWAGPVALVVGIAFTVYRSFYYRKVSERISLLQREFFNVLWLTMGLTAVAQLAGGRFFPAWGQSALWNLAESIVLFYIAMHGNRRAMLGGVVTIVSLAVANFVPTATGFILGGGVLIGYAGFGLAEMLARE